LISSEQRSGSMTALTNHTIGIVFCDGYGRCGAVPVWISAAHDEQRVVTVPLPIMDDKKAVSSAHTPGPWAACREKFMFGGTPYVAAENGHGTILACIEHGGKGNYAGQLGDPMADALLIAAAPQLLEACKLAVAELGCIGSDGDPCRTCKILQRVIAAATEGIGASVHDVPKEELSDWQTTRDFVRNRKILYVLVEDDAQDVAQREFGRELTEDELYQVRKCLEWGLGETATDIMEVAVGEAVTRG
jgi:hypothetical protein